MLRGLLWGIILGMSKVHVGVLRGGPSSEYDVSLKSGAAVLKNLGEKYQSHDILIDKKGVWHLHGAPRQPYEILKNVDVVVNAMHGEYGEDGKVQSLLDSLGVAYTGSTAMPSAVGMNKLLTKKALVPQGIKMAPHLAISAQDIDEQKIYELWRTFPQPSIVKPVGAGSSVGVTLVTNFHDLGEAIKLARTYSDTVLIEEFIKGREATCGVIDNWRGDGIYSLLPIEIVKPKHSDFFDYNSKYSSDTQEISPANFGVYGPVIQELSKRAHEALGLRHYSRSDFIVHPRRGVFFLETNTLPGMTEASLFPKSLTAIGSNLGEFLDHIITLAIKEK